MTLAEEHIYNIITNAISKRKMINLTYKSHNGNKLPQKKTVNVEPFLVGEHKTTKNLMLSAYYLPTQEQLLHDDVGDWLL